ncbi:IPT/TIG domain-containing protein [Patescibacteria group bacterium]|nr:IPT/TIG domain-containing protein [Patescibacteria group bacterium]
MTLKQKKSVLFVSLLLLLVGVFLLPQIVSAQASLGIEVGASTGLGTRDLPGLIVSVVRIFLGFLGIIAVIIILYGGFIWMTSAGEEDKINKAKKILINGVIGLIIILAAFAIVSFIINAMQGASGPGGPECEDGQTQSCSVGSCSGIQTCQANIWGACEIDPDCDPFSNPDSFRLLTVAPAHNSELGIRNVIAQMTFNNQPTDQNLDTAITIKQIDGPAGSIVNEITEFSEISALPKRLTSKPDPVSYPCPGHPELGCFPYDEINDNLNWYRVTVETTVGVGLVDTYGNIVTCGLPNTPCGFEFKVGPLIDLESPADNLIKATDDQLVDYFWLTNNINIPIGEKFTFTAEASDDAGLATMSFIENEHNYTIGMADPGGQISFIGESDDVWDTQMLGYVSGQQFNIKAVVTDYAGNQAQSTKRVKLYPTHCFNGVIDEDETGLDCGGECPACEGQSCSSDPLICVPNDDLCASNLCDIDNCLCVAAPLITSIDPDNGAPGNWVTIFGQHFGTSEGSVYFSDPVSGNLIEADLPSISGCEYNWQDNQIIVEVPPAITQGIGSVQVETAQALPSNEVDFLVNDVVRPSICLVDPPSGVFEDNFLVRGIQFGNAASERDVYFGQAEAPISALGPISWIAEINYDEASARVPNLAAGQTAVRVVVNEEDSNGLYFNVTSGYGADLVINYIIPTQGAPDQYVTIYGAGFGNNKGANTVRFTANNADGYVEGNFDFPQECGTNFWTDNQIIVKVPQSNEIITGPVRVFKDGQESYSPQDFIYDENLPVTPGICSIYPQEGEAGVLVEIAGEPFNNVKVNFSNILDLDPEAGSTNNLIKITVPEGTQSGPVRVKELVNNLESNPVDFDVQATGGENPEDNYDYYEWQFTTCADCLTPQVQESGNCWNGENASPVPYRYPMEGYNSAFINQDVGLRFSVNMKDTTFIADQTVKLQNCGSGENPTGCTDQSWSGIFTFTNPNLESSPLPEYVTFDPTSNFAADTWYKIIVTQGLTSADNINLDEDYSWYFKTRVSSQECLADQVNIIPYDRTQGSALGPIERNQTVNYSAYGFNSGNCAICPDNFTWEWKKTKWDNVNGNFTDIVPEIDLDLTDPPDDSMINMMAQNLLQQPDYGRIHAKITDVAPQPENQASLNIVPPAPQVMMDHQCNNGTKQSPTPWPNSQQVCVNAKISARFNLIMDSSTLTTSNIQVFKCVDGVCDESVTEDDNDLQLADVDGGTEFIFTPTNDLEPATWYEIFLNDNILSSEGGELTGLKIWQFKTRNNSDYCTFDSVMVAPATTILQPGDTATYSPAGQDLATCQLLKVLATTTWNWTSELDRNAVPGSNNGSGIASLNPLQTTGNATTTVTANDLGVTYIRALSSGIYNLGDNGRLTVASGGGEDYLEIIEHQPTGSDVCLNALVRSKFDYGLDEASINDSNFSVVVDAISSPVMISYNPNRTVISLAPDTPNNYWQANKTYTVKIQGGDTGVNSGSIILTTDGCPATWDDVNKICSWDFSTIPEVCGVSQVEVSPTSTVSYLGDINNWQATALNEDGLPLSNPMDSWTIDDGLVANLTDIQLPYPSSAKTVSNNIGQTWLHAQAEDAQGHASLIVREQLHGPQVLNIEPQSPPPACRNSLISIDFDQLVDHTTINNNNLIVKYLSNELSAPGCIELTAQAPSSWPKKIRATLLAKLFDTFFNNLFHPLFDKIFFKASALEAPFFWCPLESQGSWSWNNIDNRTTVYFYPQQPLPAPPLNNPYNRENIKVTIKGGEQGIKGVNLLTLEGTAAYPLVADQIEHTFSTREDICILNFIQTLADLPAEENGWAEMDEWIFTTSHDDTSDNSYGDPDYDTSEDNDKIYTVTGYSIDGQELVSIPGVYEWEWYWESEDTELATLSSDSIYYPVDHNNSFKAVEAANQNGETDIVAQAIFPPAYGVGNLEDSALAIINLCENPWPAYEQNSLLRFEDTNYDFALSYCRDAGQFGVADDLPSINEDMPVSLPIILNTTPSPDDQEDDLIREYIIPVPTTNDIIGLRIYTNFYHLSPLEWYAKNVPTGQQGNPNILTIDGYQAIQDGRTVYVAATKVIGDAVISTAYTDIYLMSYNSGASPITQEIFNQLIQNWKFNTNITDKEIKEKVIKDTKRLADLSFIANTLEGYYQTHNYQYPALSGGSYLPGMSTSKWPSWSETLGVELGVSLPIDPANIFGNCSDCDPDTDPLCQFYDPQTCWNPEVNGGQGAFACDNNSYFYRYQYQNIGPNYFLATKMEMPIPESTPVANIWQPRPDLFINSHLNLRVDKVEGCDTTSVVLCGDGIVSLPSEQCEPGQSRNWCPLGYTWNNSQLLGCDNNCRWILPLSGNPPFQGPIYNRPNYCGGYCGDGEINNIDNEWTADYEGCDVTAPLGERGFGGGSSIDNQYACGISGFANECQDYGGWCGDSVVQPFYGEQCDGSAAGWACTDGGIPSCITSGSNRCQITCSAGEPYIGSCGNGIIEGTEQCDGNNRPPHTICNNCVVTACEIDWTACDGSMTDIDGCEINTNIDPQNCGNCGLVCGSAPHSEVACVGGACDYICDPYSPWADCNGGTDGCETDISIDINNCGWCGNDCTLGGLISTEHTMMECVEDINNNYICNYTCNIGWANCSGNAECETDIMNNVNNCGSCGNVCSEPSPDPDPSNPNAACDSGQCGFTCPDGYKDNGTGCVLACGDGVLDNYPPFNEVCDQGAIDNGIQTCNSVNPIYIGGSLICNADCSSYSDAGCCTQPTFQTKFSGDNDWKLYLNGVLLEEDTSGFAWQHIKEVEAPLASGQLNVIAFSTRDTGSCYGTIGTFSCKQMTCHKVCYTGWNAGRICNSDGDCASGDCREPDSDRIGQICTQNLHVPGDPPELGCKASYNSSMDPSYCLSDDYGVTTVPGPDAGWKCITSASPPPAGWNYDPLFNESSWLEPIGTTCSNSNAWGDSTSQYYWQHKVPGATSIWGGSSGNTTSYCRLKIRF